MVAMQAQLFQLDLLACEWTMFGLIEAQIHACEGTLAQQ